MSKELFIGIQVHRHHVILTMLDDGQECSTVFPYTPIGIEGMLSLLLDYSPSHQLSIALAGWGALELALNLHDIKAQVFVVSSTVGCAARKLAYYAKHAA